MAGHQHFAGIPAEDDMLGLARLSLREAERFDGAACEMELSEGNDEIKTAKAARRQEA